MMIAEKAEKNKALRRARVQREGGICVTCPERRYSGERTLEGGGKGRPAIKRFKEEDI